MKDVLKHAATMKSNELFVTDLDGTLLRGDLTLSTFTIDTLNALIARGLRFTFATSRSPEKALALLKDLNLSLPGICLNGAVTVNVKNGDVLSSVELAYDLARRVMDIAMAIECSPFVLGRDGDRDVLAYSDSSNDAQTRFLAQRRNDPRLRHVQVACPLPLTLCITFVHGYDVLHQLNNRLAASVGDEVELKLMRDICSATDATLEVSARGVDKVARLRELCETLGTPRSNVTAFGDHLNDVEMLRFAGTPVAIGNAQEQVKAIAIHVVDTNENDGVAKYIARQFA